MNTVPPSQHHGYLYSAAAAATTFTLHPNSVLFPPPPPLPSTTSGHPQLGPSFPTALLPPAQPVAPLPLSAHFPGSSTGSIGPYDLALAGPSGQGGVRTNGGKEAGRSSQVKGSGGRGGGGGGNGAASVDWTHCGSSPSSSTTTTAPSSTEPCANYDMDDEDEELLVPATPRERLCYTADQLKLLNGIYGAIDYPNPVQKRLIAKRLCITKEQVKIWFQNRRRKDVVAKKAQESSPANSATSTTGSSEAITDNPQLTTSTPSPSTASPSTSQHDDKDTRDVISPDIQRLENEDNNDAKPLLVPGKGARNHGVTDTVIRACIRELNKYTDEKVKQKKEKLKTKGKRRVQAVPCTGNDGTAAHSENSLNPQTGMQFQAYGLAAPPNLIITTAAANRFSHSNGSSAFNSPRDQLTSSSTFSSRAWDTGLSQTLFGGGTSRLHQSSSYRGLDLSQTFGDTRNQDTLPALSDLLGQQQGNSGSGNNPQMSHYYTTSGSSTSRFPADLSRSSAGLCGNLTSASTASAVELNSLYSSPLIARSPASLHSLYGEGLQWSYFHGTLPTLPAYPFNHISQMSSIHAPYRPISIIPISNPYFPQHLAHPLRHSVTSVQGAASPSHGSAGLPSLNNPRLYQEFAAILPHSLTSLQGAACPHGSAGSAELPQL